ncbi:MAG: hypothetical protein JWQ49_1437 [Edaphobacter sp.]|jgi:hypothetical protein|nr:hypothetical protein [Edaphobacter sp.]
MYKLHCIVPLFTLSLALTFGATDAQAQAFFIFPAAHVRYRG